ncbi:protein serine/threonine kinase, putative [Entamoeba invadens IP1]|uniref:Protein serine/threonine kinase, putative n=1 Tax=Entamoeba invadens IP1 TaxID=370355 RepID=A0A0A1UA82_ENTIV|nr:protein serine/threonine kinase, putative [Entamoeba invadens IP1]ELP91890.1 protein serine/threonine kinase, putative [Entamoeba invadens IP1]|eukprot:XP_004258661.1 protein serine/threonine kinase, putative [Entamoeba invadens IP1]
METSLLFVLTILTTISVGVWCNEDTVIFCEKGISCSRGVCLSTNNELVLNRSKSGLTIICDDKDFTVTEKKVLTTKSETKEGSSKLEGCEYGSDISCDKCQEGYSLYKEGIPLIFVLKCRRCDELVDTGYDSKKYYCGNCHSNTTTDQNPFYCCDVNCAGDCKTSSCKTCVAGFVLVNYICKRCDLNVANCLLCSEVGKCDTCKDGYYISDDKTQCIQCDSSCLDSVCDKINGKCNSCASNFVFSTSNKTCENCSAFDTNCMTCNTQFERKCEKCFTGKYPVLNLTTNEQQCVDCDSTCDNQCNTENGFCEACEENKVLSIEHPLYCDSCKTYDQHCTICATDFSRSCNVCDENYFPKDKQCHPCSNITNCESCLNTVEQCTQCIDPYILQDGYCVSCQQNEYKFNQTFCQKCFETIDNCKLCSTTHVGIAVCTLCYEPFVVLNGKCISCGSEHFYNKTSLNCQTLDKCISPLNSTTCLLCQTDSFLLDNMCFNFWDSCDTNGFNNKTRKGCDCNNTISINSNCVESVENCKYFTSTNNSGICVLCNDNYTNADGLCTLINDTKRTYRDNKMFKCGSGEYLSNTNECLPCDNNYKECFSYNSQQYVLSCAKNNSINYNSNECSNDKLCETVSASTCAKCSHTNYNVINGICEKSVVDYCSASVKGICLSCDENHILSSPTHCKSTIDFFCEKKRVEKCQKCVSGYHFYQYNTDDFEYTFCEKNDDNCEIEFELGKCKKCSINALLSDGLCIPLDVPSELNDTQEYTNEMQYPFYNPKTQLDDTEKCIINSSLGCMRCVDTYYLSSSEGALRCLQCSENCLECYNSTYCLSCSRGYYLDSKKTCQSNNVLSTTCKQLIIEGDGCALCKTGYYRVERECLPCDTSCETCNQGDTCLTCRSGYFKISVESPLCQTYSNLTNCISKDDTGCLQCEPGFYLHNSRCNKCEMRCTTCSSLSICTSCKDDNVLRSGICTPYTLIEFCIRSENSMCVKCSGWYHPNDSGDRCELGLNYGVIIGVPLAVIIICIILLIIVFIIIQKVLQARRRSKQAKLNLTIFKIKNSNSPLSFLLGDKIVANMECLKFDENVEEIPVLSETREVICIGNKTKHSVLIQFSVRSEIDQFSFRFVPNTVRLRKDEACEFEVFITPYCTCEIKDQIAVVLIDLSNSQEIVGRLRVETKTELTTRLDYRELTEGKKLGQGSFGIVYKGIFRGKSVAIKKMKQSYNDEKMMKEFIKEVSMLDKFRNEYIVHFYGAVVIPNKICMVTEFAQYGSLQDVINKRTDNPLSLELRIKIVLDASRGILYLHQNGILHRDIKPDNILVISLDSDVKANAKLTDFGASRNINSLVNNMTFTKGVGTPKYMAPEVLEGQRYTEKADVFSLAISAYEVIGWVDCYPKKLFHFPWDIATFIAKGGRRPKTPNMSDEVYNLIQQIWNNDPSQRIGVEMFIDEMSQLV